MTADPVTQTRPAAPSRPAGAGRVLVAHQPAYLPWPGYFSRLLDVDQLVLLDHVQFSKGGWQNRNYIRAPHGGRLRLTVPVRQRSGQPLERVEIADDRWRARHWRALGDSYTRAPYWAAYAEDLEAVYGRPWVRLTELNQTLLRLMLDGFGLQQVTVVHSSALRPAGTATDMLIDLCRRTGRPVLRVGTGGPGYLQADPLAQAGITVEVAAYTTPPYPQPGGAFTPGLSALDLLLQHGPHAREVLRQGAQVTPWPPRSEVKA